MQNDDGGWATYARNCLDPSRLLRGVETRGLVDLSCEEITARVLVALQALGCHDREAAVSRAQRFLLARQTPQGQWFGRWSVAYVWGTSQVIQGLLASGLEPSHPAMTQAASWLKSVQNADGGWGETPAAYDDPSLAGKGESTATQTAAVVMALVAAGEARSPEAARAVEFLLRKQRRDGSWYDWQFLGTNIPGRWYARYGLLPTDLSLAALATYRTAA
jgi:squalene-hopene/tetraprenyl-beta-curcumene cyclase